MRSRVGLLVESVDLTLLIDINHRLFLHVSAPLKIGLLLWLVYTERTTQTASLLLQEESMALMVLYRLVSVEVTVRRSIHYLLIHILLLLFKLVVQSYWSFLLGKIALLFGRAAGFSQNWLLILATTTQVFLRNTSHNAMGNAVERTRLKGQPVNPLKQIHFQILDIIEVLFLAGTRSEPKNHSLVM